MCAKYIQAARQGHEETVDILVHTGANLGGLDIDGGFVSLAMKAGLRSGDEVSLKIWAKTGAIERKGGTEGIVLT